MSRLVILAVIIAQAFTNDTSSRVKGANNKLVYANEGENITLDCHAKGQNDSNGDHCEWTKNTVPIYKNGRYRFINNIIAGKENSIGVDKPRENDCSIQIINFTSKIDQGNWSCVKIHGDSDTDIQNKYIENYTVILKTTDKLHPEQAFATTKTNSIDEERLLIFTCNSMYVKLIYMIAAIGGAAIIIFIVTVACFVKNKKRNSSSSDAIATTISAHSRAVQVDVNLYDDVLINKRQYVYEEILHVKANSDIDAINSNKDQEEAEQRNRDSSSIKIGNHDDDIKSPYCEMKKKNSNFVMHSFHLKVDKKIQSLTPNSSKVPEIYERMNLRKKEKHLYVNDRISQNQPSALQP